MELERGKRGAFIGGRWVYWSVEGMFLWSFASSIGGDA
jgi:hypothetical protein